MGGSMGKEMVMSKFKPKGMPDLNYLKSILDYDPLTGIFKWKDTRNGMVNIGDVAGWLSKQQYKKIRIFGKDYLAHRLAYYYVTGIDPSKKLVDHKDGDTQNNKFENLRLCTHSQNKENSKKHKDNTSGYKGVSWRKDANKWRASIIKNKKQIHLGYFDTPEEAYETYCKASEKYHKEFGRLD